MPKISPKTINGNARIDSGGILQHCHVGCWQILTSNKTPTANTENKKIIPIAMGDAGKWTRILGLAHGAFMTYASLETGDETASGQVTARDLVEVYRVKEIDRSTRIFGVIGDPVTRSLSPYMHNAAFVDKALNAAFLHLTVKNLVEFITGMVKTDTREIELNFGGFSVTMPHKQCDTTLGCNRFYCCLNRSRQHC